jgi:hypothetical protein
MVKAQSFSKEIGLCLLCNLIIFILIYKEPETLPQGTDKQDNVVAPVIEY